MAMLYFQDADSLSISVFLIFISLFCEACCQGMILNSSVIMVLYIIQNWTFEELSALNSLSYKHLVVFWPWPQTYMAKWTLKLCYF